MLAAKPLFRSGIQDSLISALNRTTDHATEQRMPFLLSIRAKSDCRVIVPQRRLALSRRYKRDADSIEKRFIITGASTLA